MIQPFTEEPIQSRNSFQMKEKREKDSPLRDYPMFEEDTENDSGIQDSIPSPGGRTSKNTARSKISPANREQEVPVYEFKIKYILGALLIALFLLAIFSYDPADTSIIDGGTEGHLANWGGLIGANLSKFFFYVFGLATYPIALLLTLSAVRTFIPVPMKRKGYFLSLLAVITGTTLLMAISPQDFVVRTASLGIGHMDAPFLALSGGVFGAYFAAPETDLFAAGILRMYIGTVGTVVTASVLLVSGLVFIFLADWKDILLRFLSGNSISVKMPSFRRKNEEEEEDDEEEISPLITTGKGRKNPVKKSASAEMQKEEELDNEEIYEDENEEEYKENELREQEEEELDNEETNDELPLRKVMVAAEDDCEEENEEVKTLPAAAASPVNDTQDAYAADIREKAQAPDMKKQTPPIACNGNFELPPVPMLTPPPADAKTEDAAHLNKAKATLQATLDSFDIAGQVSGTVVGPRITRFEITLEPGVKVDKVTGIQNNIAMDMCATSVRVLAPIPGKNAVGVEVPNKISNMVFIRELFESPACASQIFTLSLSLQ